MTVSEAAIMHNNLLDEYAGISKTISMFAQSLDGFNKMIAPGLYTVALEMSRLIKTTLPYYTDAVRLAVQSAQAITPYIAEATRYMRDIGIQLSPIIEALQRSKVNWGELNGLAASVGALAREYDFNDDIFEEEYAADERDEVVAVANEIISMPENWEHRLVAAVKQFKERRPALSWLFISIMSAILGILLNAAGNLLAETLKPSPIRDEPKSTAPIVTNIDVYQTITIIGDAPYYFEIEFQDNETGEYHSGWITKRSVRVAETSNTEDDSILEIDDIDIQETDTTGE